MRFRRTPLAWRSITHDKKRFLLSIAGVMFATILMFTQLGFLNAVFDSQAEPIKRLNADLVIVNRSKQRFGINEPFGRRRLDQARQADGVAAVYPLYLAGGSAFWKNTETGKLYPVRVIGMNPGDPVFRDEGMNRLLALLRKEDSVLLDAKSKEIFGPRPVGLQTELSGHRVRIAGLFSLGTDFDYNGTVLTGEHTFLKIFPENRTSDSRTGRVELGLVRVKPGVSAERVQTLLEATLPQDVRVRTLQELTTQEIGFWRSETPVGFIFGLGLVIGLVVGVVICSQIVYTNVLDRMPLFGTLKAIGYTNGYLIRLVTGEALWLSVIAFIPALLFSHALYTLLSQFIGFAMFLTPGRILLILSLTLGMSLVASVVALSKALTADPAEVFK